MFSDNRITQLFGIKYPLIQAGMIWCSGWELASAVSNAGGLGLIGSGSMDPDTLRIHIRKCRAATTHPFGVNVPLLYSRIEEQLDVIISEKVKIVFTSAGNPATWTGKLKAAGITVVHVVSNARFAAKAEKAGVDGIVAEGFEAGGHNGREELTTFVLIPLVRKTISVPLIAAGGVVNGEGMLAAFALGAEGVQVGSRFVASEESSAHHAFKKKVIETPEDGTVLTLKEITPVRLLKNKFFQDIQSAYSNGANADALNALLGKGRSKKGMFEGDLEEGELEIGQAATLLKEILPAKEIVKRMMDEYEEARIRLIL